MRRNYVEDARRISAAIDLYEAQVGPLPGISEPEHREALIEQIIDSEQRVRYFGLLQSRPLSAASGDPHDDAFDPVKASIIHRDRGDLDEAIWLAYLFVHFGRHRRAGWRYVRDVYGALGAEPWTWERTSNDITSFRFWLDDHQEELRRSPGPHGFGNHRKYESLKAWTPTGTGEAFESYINWVHDAGDDHEARLSTFDAATPESRFEAMYKSLGDVKRLGRIGRFDYLMTLKKLGLADIAPPHSYLVGATGPLAGARLLLEEEGTHSLSARQAQEALREFSNLTGLPPDVMEDAVCNWQKSPSKYLRFSG
ncbi:hypothetical protein FLP10_12020 [Agromyces intestinalis]|uniref:Alpha-glutamyl/putrescinyl thymine pyrophosphorylase clade 3 domain-containing protein n=1 Tax=Agromyces intestinalis TaxID=2592652 RepID=A0A5C1YGF3_9MICO|nr:hypothetical protein [Agromyces intestinalis]QEO15061.1 hypothetical protein FLP10_12020 [Agromyces intestinalis]